MCIDCSATDLYKATFKKNKERKKMEVKSLGSLTVKRQLCARKLSIFFQDTSKEREREKCIWSFWSTWAWGIEALRHALWVICIRFTWTCCCFIFLPFSLAMNFTITLIYFVGNCLRRIYFWICIYFFSFKQFSLIISIELWNNKYSIIFVWK